MGGKRIEKDGERKGEEKEEGISLNNQSTFTLSLDI